MTFEEWWGNNGRDITLEAAINSDSNKENDRERIVAATAWEAAQQETLRDKFAAVALNGMLSNSSSLYDFEGAAQDAFRYADAMLKERSK